MSVRRSIALLLLAVPAVAAEVPVSGTVTYLASGVVYTSLGRNQGIDENSRLWIGRGTDTLATLKIVALSSKSSACSVLTSRGEIRVGATVTALVRRGDVAAAPAPPPVTTAEPSGRGDSARIAGAPRREVPPFEIRGRVSAQVRTVEYSGEAAGLRQPGLVLSLQGRSAAVPITADISVNFRTASLGNQGFFSPSAVNQSRYYRLSLTYDDGWNSASVGRTISPLAWTLGSIDGAILTRKLGRWKVGGAAGFQPEGGSRGMSTDSRKLGLFASYEFPGGDRGFVSAVYARSYTLTTLDRESVSGLTSVTLTPDLSLQGNGEVDLRRKQGEAFVLKPSLTALYVTLNYRPGRLVRIGVGGEASRPVFAFSDVQHLPDSLIERRLVWGLSLALSVFPLPGVAISNTIMPRSRGSAAAKELVDFASITLSDFLSSGLTVRSDLNVSHSEYTKTLGWGAALQRQLFSVADVSLRYHRSRYTILRGGARSFSTTMGADLVVPFTRAVALFGSYEWFDGYGTQTRSVMAELSVRF
jgi:hypothetical protein